MLKQKNVSVSTGTTLLLAATQSGQLTVITNMGSSPLFIGGSDVTTANGLELLGGVSMSIDLQPGEALYGVRATGTANALVIYSSPFIASSVVPQVISVGLGSTLPSSPATVITTSAGLPANPVDGQLAFLRVGAWPDVEYVLFIWDNTSSKWVSRNPQPLISMGDQVYMGTNTTAYSYISTDTVGGTTNAIGWSTRPIRRATDLYAAGFKLQVNASAIMKDASTPAAFTVQPKFFQHNDGDTVTFSSDGSTAVAELATALVSVGANPFFKATGWQNLVKLGTSTVIAAADITKENLWPRLYGKVASGTAYGSIIDVDVQYRWTN